MDSKRKRSKAKFNQFFRKVKYNFGRVIDKFVYSYLMQGLYYRNYNFSVMYVDKSIN